jgi:dipeptidyl aminopeptidase/acylaminoacyl peptidase
VVGDLKVVEVTSGHLKSVYTGAVDIAHAEWRSDRVLLLAGHRGLETVIEVCNPASGQLEEIWAGRDISTGGIYASVSGFGEHGDCAFVAEGFLRAPEIAVVHRGEYRAVKSLDAEYANYTDAIAEVQTVSWRAPDGLEIQGWVVRPRAPRPHPLIMYVHGGPVYHVRSFYLGRKGALLLLLLMRGYAVFFPNVRGSSGRGQDFAARVLGDMGGADTHDFLSGLDYLVSQGIADETRLGITGGSYGGFMTSWLVTQDTRFAAAVSVSPVTNHVTEHLVSNIPHFVRLFLADSYTNPSGKYFQRSPVMHAQCARTPTLNVCGALDRCTPPVEAMQFHSALLENGVESVLVTYPEEGHGVQKLPAAIDYTARVISWFEQYMPASEASTGAP